MPRSRPGTAPKRAGNRPPELDKTHIAAAIEKGQNKRGKRLQLTGDMVVEELRKIGFANMVDYVSVAVSDDPRRDFLALGRDLTVAVVELVVENVIDGRGDPRRDFLALGRDLTAAVVELVVENVIDGRGENAREVRRVKFKLHDRQAALVNLGRHLGLFVTGQAPARFHLHFTRPRPPGSIRSSAPLA